jgi:hypothetical protein
MTYQGTVENGVVVFPHGEQPPEGSPVRVELISQAPPAEQPDKNDILLSQRWV